MAWEYYSFIEADPESGADDVKRSCFRKRKALAIAEDNVGLEHLNEVERVLRDPRARVEYDAMQEHGDEIDDLMGAADAAVEEERWGDGTRALKQVLALAPGQAFPLSLLALCLFKEDRLHDARNAAERLVALHSDTPSHWDTLGRIEAVIADVTPTDIEARQGRMACPHCDDAQFIPSSAGVFKRKCSACHEPYVVNTTDSRSAWFVRARGRFRRAIEMEDYNASFYIEIARTHENEGDNAEALKWAEKAIWCDGEVSFQDFEPLFYIAKLHGTMRNPEGIYNTARRVIEILLSEPDARDYAAHKFAALGANLHEYRDFECAGWFAYAGQMILPSDERIRSLVESSATLNHAYAQYGAFMADTNLDDSIKRAASFFLASEGGEDLDDEEALFSSICEHLDSRPPHELRVSLYRLRTSYPAIYKCGERFFNDLIAALPPVVTQPAGSTYPTPAATGSGCLLALPLALGAAIFLASVPFWR